MLAGVPWGCGGEDHPRIAVDEPGTENDDSANRDDEGSERENADDDGAGDDADDNESDPDGGVGSRADGGAGAGDDGAPQVEVLLPADEDTPIEVFDENLDVSCRIEESDADGAKEVDPASVLFELLIPGGEIAATQVGVRADEAGVFEASFPTRNVPAGPVSVRCSASDTSAQPISASAEVGTFLDHGPLVTIVTPTEGGAESARGAVAFEYAVEPDELVEDDEGAGLDEIVLLLLGDEFDLVEREDEPGVFRTTVDFSDTELFAEVPSGVLQIAVAATNQRGITRTTRYEFILDGTGPVISVESPRNAEIVGGKVDLELEIRDAVSAVDWDTLVVSLNDVDYPYDADGPWQLSGGTATFTFESGEVTGSVVQINVNVRVADVAGNASPGAAVLYYRDEYGPIVSMNPPGFREWDSRPNPTVCSESFDPLGIAPANGDRVPDIAQYRALVVDRTNSAAGQDVLHLSWVDPANVDLFVQRAGEALVVDTTGNGVCDDIVDPEPAFQELTPLKPEGNPLYTAGAEADDLTLERGCVFADRNPPRRLCDEEASDLTIVVGHGVDRDEPVVYAVSPDNGLECTGRRWELRSGGLANYQGWVCLAVRAFDNVGNRGVSNPIAVCLENSQVEGLPGCHQDLTEEPPDCTDGCSAAPELSGPVLYER